MLGRVRLNSDGTFQFREVETAAAEQVFLAAVVVTAVSVLVTILPALQPFPSLCGRWPASLAMRSGSGDRYRHPLRALSRLSLTQM